MSPATHSPGDQITILRLKSPARVERAGAFQGDAMADKPEADKPEADKPEADKPGAEESETEDSEAEEPVVVDEGARMRRLGRARAQFRELDTEFQALKKKHARVKRLCTHLERTTAVYIPIELVLLCLKFCDLTTVFAARAVSRLWRDAADMHIGKWRRSTMFRAFSQHPWCAGCYKAIKVHQLTKTSRRVGFGGKNLNGTGIHYNKGRRDGVECKEEVVCTQCESKTRLKYTIKDRGYHNPYKRGTWFADERIHYLQFMSFTRAPSA
jgi:hypothetical protein